MRRTPPAVIVDLLKEPHRFGFFQTVRILQRWFARSEGLSDRRVLDERLRFRNALALDFPPSEVAELRTALLSNDGYRRASDPAGHGDAADPIAGAAWLDAEGDPDSTRVRHVEITPSFMGLLGVMGVLPLHYTERIAQRELYHRDKAARAFLDIFQHRAVALFYEGWRKNRLPLHYEADGQNRYLPLVLALAGLGQTSLRNRLRPSEGGMSDHAVAFYAGAFQKRSLSAQALQRMVSMYFGVGVALTSLVGRWYALPESQRSLIGQGHVTLGRDALVGERVWQRDLRVRLDIGPLTRATFLRFLPGASAAVALRQILELLTGSSLEYEIRLHLRADEVRGSTLDATQGPQLGWDSFLVTKPVSADRSDAGYDVMALA